MRRDKLESRAISGHAGEFRHGRGTGYHEGVRHTAGVIAMAFDTEFSSLPRMSESIDRIDAALLQLLAARFSLSREIGRVKVAAGMPIFDPTRIRDQTRGFIDTGLDLGLDAAMLEKLIGSILDRVVEERRMLSKPER